jgi:hypothetical protein
MMHALDALLGLVLTLGAVYGLDRWVLTLREAGYRTFDMAPFWWSSMLANMATGGLLLALAWLVLFRGRRSYTVLLAYLVTGLGFTFLPLILARLPASIALFSAPEFRVLRVTLLYSTPNTRLHLVGAAVAAIGVIGMALALRERLSGSLLWLADWLQRV